jgi:hypothetical protein
MPKLHVELDGPPGQALIIQDGAAQFDISQLGIILDATTGQRFVNIARLASSGLLTATAHDITKATLTIHYEEA